MRGSAVASPLSDYLSPTHLRWLAGETDGNWRADEATLVFGDVSGFTALGERLARRGRVGSEDLTDAITAVFASMNGAVTAAGGEILKFGGDAILARFVGERHEARGATAAVSMRETLEDLRLPGLRGGVARLSMSIGVASGTSHLFLAGTDPRDLIAAGPLATEVVDCEGQAEGGEIILGPRTSGALPDAASRARSAGHLLLEAPPEEPTGSPDPSQAPATDPDPGLPPHLRDHAPGDGEHRSAAVAFIKYSGSDDLLAQEGPEALAAALEAVVARVSQACKDWGLTFVSSDVDANGGKLILAAGAPHASPDDDDHIVHALHEIVNERYPLAVRAGVNRGPVFAADIGREGRRVWSLMGDAVNLAARVMAHADPGTVLATPSVTSRLRDEFDRTPVEPFTAKGKSEPVRAERIGDPRGRGVQAFAGPLVGREEELRMIEAGLEAARAGDWRVVELVADPGIGKSRLATATRERAHGMTVMDIQGGPYSVRTPYLGLRRALLKLVFGASPPADLAGALERRVRELDERLEPWTPLIATAFGVELPPTPETAALSPEFARERLASALSRLLGAAAPPGPALVLVEDSHWLDEASLDFLARLLDRSRVAGERGIFALITRRPNAGRIEGIADVETVDLAPLGPDALRELVGSDPDSETALSPRQRDEVIAKAQGNPLLLGELAAAAREGKSVEDLPDSVETLMNARIAGLPAGDRRLLREASVLGNEVSLPLLAEVLGADRRTIDVYLNRLEAFLVPVRSDTVRFSHALLRDAAYASLSYRRRRELHARAGDALRELGRPDELAGILAIHYTAARRWSETWEFGRIAGGQALRRAAPHEAASFLRGAVNAARWVKEIDRAELRKAVLQLGEASELAGSYDEARRAYARARDLAEDDPLEQAEILLREGRLREGAASVSQAIRYYRRGLETVGTRRSPKAASLRARLILAEGGTRLHSGRHRMAVPLLERAVKEAERAADHAALGHAYYLLDWAHSDLGNPEAARYRDLALPIFEELGDFDKQGRVLTNLGVNAYHEGRWGEALELYERARVASDRAGDTIGASFNVNNVAEIRLEQGRVDEAELLLEDVLDTWRAARFNFGVGNALRNLARIETRRGDYARAGELFDRGREAFAKAGLESSRLELETFDAKRLLLTGRVDEARELALEIQAAAKRIDVIPNVPPFVTRILALCELREGRRGEGIRLLGRAVAMSEGVGAIYELALALDALGDALGAGGTDEQARARELFRRLDVVAPPATGVSGS
jgi:class 3 adenylate cyclase/tetratricopeptide (TPR) repeat protein